MFNEEEDMNHLEDRSAESACPGSSSDAADDRGRYEGREDV